MPAAASAPPAEATSNAPPPPQSASPSPILALQRGPEDAPLQPVGDDLALRLIAGLLGRRVRVSRAMDGERERGTEQSNSPPTQSATPTPPRSRSPPSLCLQVTAPDGRTIAGTLTCLDPQANIVLADARAVGGGGGGGGGADHALGTLIMPAAQRAACVLEVEPHEAEKVRGEISAAATGGGEEEEASALKRDVSVSQAFTHGPQPARATPREETSGARKRKSGGCDSHRRARARSQPGGPAFFLSFLFLSNARRGRRAEDTLTHTLCLTPGHAPPTAACGEGTRPWAGAACVCARVCLPAVVSLMKKNEINARRQGEAQHCFDLAPSLRAVDRKRGDSHARAGPLEPARTEGSVGTPPPSCSRPYFILSGFPLHFSGRRGGRQAEQLAPAPTIAGAGAPPVVPAACEGERGQRERERGCVCA